MKKSSLTLPLIVFVPVDSSTIENVIAIVESVNITSSSSGKSFLNINWRFNNDSMRDRMSPDDKLKVETYITNYVISRI